MERELLTSKAIAVNRQRENCNRQQEQPNLGDTAQLRTRLVTAHLLANEGATMRQVVPNSLDRIDMRCHPRSRLDDPALAVHDNSRINLPEEKSDTHQAMAEPAPQDSLYLVEVVLEEGLTRRVIQQLPDFLVGDAINIRSHRAGATDGLGANRRQ